ncbi:MAG TPA: Rieske 2Fe-2S domain-containing protein [Alphaproteobacteria bacterium]|jgi:5,5'-dehydrodivanillate O-demethylase
MARSGKVRFADLEKVGPGTPAGRYLRRFWQPVMRAKDLAPGRARPLEILGEKFTLYRGEDGTPHVVAYRCAHRGTPLSLGWVEGDTLRCRYHGWRFDGTGQCVEQPNEDRPFCDKVRLGTYPTREYAGLIFAFLGEGDPPAFPRYPDLDRPGVFVVDPVEILPCSYWNRFDNDHGHRPWVHRATALRKNRPDILVIRHEEVEETPYGWRGTRTVKGEDEDVSSSLGTIEGERRTAQTSLGFARSTHWFMPNVRLFFQPTRARGFQGRDLWDTKMSWAVPIDDRKHAAFDVTLTPLEGAEAEAFARVRAEQEEEAETRWDLAEKILAGEMTLEDLPDDIGAYTSFTIEDYVTQVGQGPIEGRGEENVALSEQRLVLLRRLWLREVNALVAGKPLTRWRVPERPLQERAREASPAEA